MKGDFESGNVEWTVVREPRPEDIGQGELGNCLYVCSFFVHKLVCLICECMYRVYANIHS